MSDLRNYILSKLYEMAKAPKKKVEPKKPVKTEPSHEDQEDFAKWQDENNPMSNVQQEAIDFSKKTIAGKAARKTAAETLKHHKAKQQAKPGATPRGVAKEVKAFSQDTYKQRESTILKDRMVEILFEAFETRNRFETGSDGRQHKSTQLSKSPERLAKIKAKKDAKAASMSPEQKASSQHAPKFSRNLSFKTTGRPQRPGSRKNTQEKKYGNSDDSGSTGYSVAQRNKS